MSGLPHLLGTRSQCRESARQADSFAKTELAEDGIQEILDGGLAHHLAQGCQGHPQLEGHQFEGRLILQPGPRADHRFPSTLQHLLVPNADRYAIVANRDRAGQESLFDGVLRSSMPAPV